MSRRVGVGLLVSLSTGCAPPGGDSPAQQPLVASKIFSGGQILTLTPDRPRVEALAVADGRILGMGSGMEMERYRGAETTALDLAGGVLLPGFVDHHVHLLNMGISLLWAESPPAYFVDLSGASSEAEIADRLEARARELSRGSWILGKGWSQGAWGSSELPDQRVLTESVPGHRVFLTRVDGHAGWLNAVALREAGIDRSTPDPAGGSIRRHPDGEPTGVLLERANESVTALLPRPTDDDVMAAFRRATRALAAQGVTEVFDAGFLAVPGIVDLGLDLERYLDLLVRADQEESLPVRINLMIPAPSELARRVTRDPAFDRELSPRLRVTHLKLFMDGAMGSRGALLSHPYADDPTTHGVRRMTPQELKEEALRALDAGLDVATHAIGDQAVADALDVYETILASRAEVAPARLRLEHFSYAQEGDFSRAAALGIVLSVQPNFVFPGNDGLAMEDARVGAGNSGRVYAWGRLHRLGARLAFGSDYFTRPLSPLYTFYAAVTRRNPAGLPEAGWHPEEILERLETLRVMTTVQRPGTGGSEGGELAVGNPADFVVLSADPLSVGNREIQGIGVEATFLAGEPSFP